MRLIAVNSKCKNELMTMNMFMMNNAALSLTSWSNVVHSSNNHLNHSNWSGMAWSNWSGRSWYRWNNTAGSFWDKDPNEGFDENDS